MENRRILFLCDGFLKVGFYIDLIEVPMVVTFHQTNKSVWEKMNNFVEKEKDHLEKESFDLKTR